MADWQIKPNVAFKKYIRPFVKKPKWVEDSNDISNVIKLNKRELFALIVLAHAYGNDWIIGYNSSDSEPNDGYITNGKEKIQIEHKVIAQMDKREVLDAILGTYKKYAARGKGYGENRVLIIQPNKAPKHGGLIKISSLKDAIKGESPFDKVYTVALNSFKDINNRFAVMHIIEHYPRKSEATTDRWITQIDLDLKKGSAEVPLRSIIH